MKGGGGMGGGAPREVKIEMWGVGNEGLGPPHTTLTDLLHVGASLQAVCLVS